MKKVILHLRSLILAFIILFGYYQIHAQPTIEVSGDITANTTWSSDTVKVIGDVTVKDNITLIVNPGTYVEFKGYFRLKVYGTLLAEGTEEDAIVFTINDTTGISDPDTTLGSWHGILFDNGYYGMNGAMFDNDTSKLSHCRFEFCKTSEMVGNGVVIEIIRFSKIIVENCEIKNNFAKIGATIFCSSSSATFRKNIIANNKIHTVIDLSGNSSAIIEGNFIANNTGCAISISESSPFIIGNIIVNNSYTLGLGSGGIVMVRSNPLIINNTICNNYSIHSAGGILFSASTPKLYNNIIWGNTSAYYGLKQIHLETANSSPDIYNCLIQGGTAGFAGQVFTGKYIDNVETDPKFIIPSAGSGHTYDGLNANWNLAFNSPCINTGFSEGLESKMPGTDYNKTKRIKYGEIDIGALEFYNNYIDITENILNDTTWFADTVKIWNYFYVDNGATLTIFPGTIIQFQGKYKMDIGGTLLAEGTPTEKIKFTVADTTYFSNPDSTRGGWGGLRFGSIQPTNDSSSLSWCIFEYGKTGSVNDWNTIWTTDMYGGAVLVYDFPKLKITNCQFSHNRAKYGGAIFLENSDIFISNNIITHNYAQGFGGGIYVGASDAEISNNFISNNATDLYGGGLYIGGVIETPLIRNNIICNNTGNYGGGIACFTTASMINNTVVNNHSKNYSGGILVYNCKPYIVNTVMWGNTVGSSMNQVNAVFNGSPLIYNCNIQNGFSNLKEGIGEGVYVNNIDLLPGFINPSQGSGTSFTSSPDDWSITDFSPCINKGSIDFQGIPDADYQGKPRINGGQIDIGAIENQSGLLYFMKHPSGKVKCEGESVSFAVEVSDTAYIQWMKDGIALTGKTEAILTIDSVTMDHQGNYTCMISNSYGDVESNPAFLLVNEKPGFLSNPAGMWAEQYKPVSLRAYARGNNLSYKWQKNGVDKAGANTSELIITAADYSDEGAYTCIISSACGHDTTSPAQLYIAPQICMVTVSTVSGNNLVIWEKNSKAPLTAYNIYRESTAAGIYDLMGTVPYSNLSLYEDLTADPTKRAYIYKITGIDASGFETDLDLCKSHKTIHLIVSTNPELNTTQLQWDKYFGFDYQTYTIYKSSTGTNFDFADAMPATLNSWTETNPAEGDVFYRISVEKPDPCFPSGAGKKADTGPYSHSMSNIDDNRLQAGENPPDTIMLTNASIAENNIYGMLIGRLKTTDKDSLDTHIYSLVDGEGSEGNFSFTILGDMLLAADIFDYEVKDNYSVRVRCTDRSNLTKEQVFIILINDVDETVGLNGPVVERLRIYPNPFRETAIIQFSNPDLSEYSLYITDLTGKVVYFEDNIFTGRIEVSREGLPAGYYFVELRGERLFRGRMIVE